MALDFPTDGGRRGLSKADRTRDHLDIQQLRSIAYLEGAIERVIVAAGVSDEYSCVNVANMVADCFRPCFAAVEFLRVANVPAAMLPATVRAGPVVT